MPCSTDAHRRVRSSVARDGAPPTCAPSRSRRGCGATRRPVARRRRWRGCPRWSRTGRSGRRRARSRRRAPRWRTPGPRRPWRPRPPMASATATGTVTVDVGRHDGGRALGRESLGQCPSDPRCRTGDDDDLVANVHGSDRRRLGAATVIAQTCAAASIVERTTPRRSGPQGRGITTGTSTPAST